MSIFDIFGLGVKHEKKQKFCEEKGNMSVNDNFYGFYLTTVAGIDKSYNAKHMAISLQGELLSVIHLLLWTAFSWLIHVLPVYLFDFTILLSPKTPLEISENSRILLQMF